MQAKISHSLPTTMIPSSSVDLPALSPTINNNNIKVIPSSPANVNNLSKVSSPANTKVPRAISIAAPTHQVPALEDVEEDAAAAFWDYQFLFLSQRSETMDGPVSLRVVDGAIPADFPSGTYYLTGPGLFSDDHGSTVHPLDGHGYLRAFTVDGGTGRVHFMAKYVRTEAQAEERDPVTGRWRFTHRGPFSVLKGGRMVGNTKVMKNVANTSVLGWHGRLLCMWEGGEPYEIDSSTLDTAGSFSIFDGSNSTPSPRRASFAASGDVWDVAAAILRPLLYGIAINFV